MRLSDYLGCEVISADGRKLGHVLDARLVADGPELGAFGPALRLHDLIVGRGSLGARLGLDRERVRGPWLLKVLFARRRLRRVPWEAIADVHDGTITLSISTDRLDELGSSPPQD